MQLGLRAPTFGPGAVTWSGLGSNRPRYLIVVLFRATTKLSYAIPIDTLEFSLSSASLDAICGMKNFLQVSLVLKGSEALSGTLGRRSVSSNAEARAQACS